MVVLYHYNNIDGRIVSSNDFSNLQPTTEEFSCNTQLITQEIELHNETEIKYYL